MPDDAEEDLKKIEFDFNVGDDEIQDLNDEDALHLNDGLAANNNDNIEDIGVINEHDDQHNHFGAPDDNIQQQNHHFGRRVRQNLDADDEDDDDNGQFNVVGDDVSSAYSNNDEYYDNRQPESNSYSNFGNESASESSYQDDDVDVK